jgi:hypothetical protein
LKLLKFGQLLINGSRQRQDKALDMMTSSLNDHTCTCSVELFTCCEYLN